MYFRNYYYTDFFGDCSTKLQAEKRGSPTSKDFVMLQTTVPLHHQFDDWRSLLEFRNRCADRYGLVYFVVKGVIFGLDELTDDEAKSCEEDCQWCGDYNFNCFGRDFACLRNVVIFRPRDGTGRLFRFTVGQRWYERWYERLTRWDRFKRAVSRKRKCAFKFTMENVMLSFLQLMIQSQDDFSTMESNHECACLQPTIDHTIPGFSGDDRYVRVPNQINKLPMEQILERVDAAEFIGIDFNELACQSFDTIPANIKELKFHSCTFADGGEKLFHALPSSNQLQNFEIELCPVDPEVIGSVTSNALPLKSLAIGLHYLFDENHCTWAKNMCAGKDLGTVSLIGRENCFEGVTIDKWLAILDTFQQRPTLPKLNLIMDDSAKFPEDLVWKIEPFYPQEFLDGSSVEILNVLLPWSSDGWRYKFDQYYNVGTQMQRLVALNTSSYRHALLSQVIHADAKIAGLNNMTFSILKDNPDILNN